MISSITIPSGVVPSPGTSGPEAEMYMFSLLYHFCGLDQIMLMYRMKDQQRIVMIGTTPEALEVSKTRMMG